MPELHLELSGPEDAPLVIGIPGLSANLRSFDLLRPAVVARGRRFAAVDLRGRGRTPAGRPGSHGWAAHAADVIATADRLGVRRFAVAGWSMGAFVTLEVARQAPDRLERALLIDAIGRVDPQVIAVIRSGLERLERSYPSAREYLELVRGLGVVSPWGPFWEGYYGYELQAVAGGVRARTSKAAALEDLEYDQGGEAERLWPELTMPLMLARGARPLFPGTGHLVSPEVLAAFRHSVPQAEVVEVDANHYGIIADPLLVEAGAAFLAQPDGAWSGP